MPELDVSPQKNKLQISVDYKWLSVVLAVIIAALIGIWQPWDSVNASDRTVSVTGTAKLKAEPDQFVFYPNYEFKNTNKTEAIAAMSVKSNEIVAALMKLGVAEKDIKNNSNGYDRYNYYSKTNDETVYSLNFTVTVGTKELAQKTADYLFTTEPAGQVTPQGQFSEAKQKDLEDKARTEASKDARAKAEKSAKIIGYRLGKVKSVQDGVGFDGPVPYDGMAIGLDSSNPGPLTLQPGQEDVYYNVSVVYFVK